MKITIAGGRGFIGQALVKSLNGDHQITIISRSEKSLEEPNAEVVTWQDNRLKEILEQSDVVINLVGENIAAKRWSDSQKKQIIESRTVSTKTLVKYLSACKTPPRLINASAIGIYGVPDEIDEQQNICFTEESVLPEQPKDFLQDVGLQWERELENDLNYQLHISILRFGVVLAPDGGMLKQLLPIYKCGLGGKVGSGCQPLSWISRTDVVRFIEYLIVHPQVQGVFNLVAPEVITQQKFAQTLASVLKRPAFMSLPSFMVRLMFGEMGDLLLSNGQTVASTRLKRLDFQLQYPHLKEYLLSCL